MDIPKKLKKDISDYCGLNDIKDIEGFIIKCLQGGFDIERYGLLNENEPKVVEKIVYKDVIKEVIKEVPKIEYVEVEKIVEVSGPVIENKEKQKSFEATIQKLKKELTEKNKLVLELQENLIEIKKTYNKPAMFLDGSNLTKIIK